MAEVSSVWQNLGNAAYAAVGMLWLILWALILGFAISGMIQTFVSKKKMAALLGKPGIKQLGLASFFGAMSSSCSYAASSMARSLFEKGAHIIPSLAFMLASTNLVLELSIVLWVMMGLQFVLAEFVGGIILVLLMATLMKLFGPMEAFAQLRSKRNHADLGANDSDEDDTASWASREGWVQAAQSFVMEGQMIWKDVAIGVGVSGLLMVFVPDSFWQTLFVGSADHSGQFILSKSIENALVGPLVSMLSFVCSVGNIPLASVLFHGGITFGGAISFIYGDLIILPLILVYRKYYGWKLALWIVGVFYISMAFTGILVDLIFTTLHWVPSAEAMPATPHSMHFFEMNYTFWLNLVFIAVAGALFLISKQSNSEAHHDCCH